MNRSFFPQPRSDLLLGYPQAYLVPALQRVLGDVLTNGHGAGPIFDIGCGDGTLDHFLEDRGFTVIGLDADKSRIREAKARYPQGHYVVGSAYEDLHLRYGTFPCVLSVEVIEHLFDPHRFADTVSALLEPRGVAIITTPFHGYLKNLLLAASGLLDRHFTALWPGGHIKFWSIKTISQLLVAAGLEIERVVLVDRVPPLARSMIVVARKPGFRSRPRDYLH